MRGEKGSYGSSARPEGLQQETQRLLAKTDQSHQGPNRNLTAKLKQNPWPMAHSTQESLTWGKEEEEGQFVYRTWSKISSRGPGSQRLYKEWSLGDPKRKILYISRSNYSLWTCRGGIANHVVDQPTSRVQCVRVQLGETDPESFN